MTKISADNILFDFAIFLMMAVPFGVAAGGVDVQNSLNSIFAPWPTLAGSVQSTPKCSPTDFLCQANAGIAQATAFIAVPFLWIGNVLGSALARVNGFGTLISLVTFGPTTSLAAVPGIGLLVVGLVVVVAWELFRSIRGSPSGA